MSSTDANAGTTVDLEALKAVHRSYPTGVTIVTAAVEDEVRGLTVNAFASISLTPPLIMVAIAQNAATHEFLYRGRQFAVNVLATDQVPLLKRFSQPIPDKFEGVGWSSGVGGAPILDGVAAVLEALIVQRAQAFTHTVFVAEVTRAQTFERPPLIYMGSRFFDSTKVGPPLEG